MKTLIVYLIAIATVIAAAIFAKTIVKASVYVPDSTGIVAPVEKSGMAATSTTKISATSSQSAQTVLPAGYPVKLNIPSLGINASVQDVGITARGNVGIPNNFVDVGWYSYGPLPGKVGSALIDGHVDNGLSLAGVFKHLSDIKVGDDVYVTDYAGQVYHFVVSNIQYYGYEDASTSEIFDDPQGAAELKLITCGGTWVPDQKTYDQRLVVTTVLQ